MNMPQVEQDFFALEGGLDLLTPAITLEEGKCFDAQNYEPEISGGYRRIDGYERFDGHPSPSSATYWLLPVAAFTATVGATITGATSGATGKVLAIFGAIAVLGRLTGTFQTGEGLLSGGAVGTATATQQFNGATTASDDADYTLLAANDLRLDVQKVPGSGPIRGVWLYKDVKYAFRDNVGGTAGQMWKSTTGGWVQVALGTEIQFINALAAGSTLAIGNTITGGTSGATAIVNAIVMRTGGFNGSGVGSLVITPVSGSFVNAENIQIGATPIATSASASTPITRLPGGTGEFNNYNFSGSTPTTKMYGVDGVNLLFEYDGTTYVPIRTGMANDAPSHVKGHRNALFLSFLGSVQLSAVGKPYAWTAVLGAAEISVGDPVSGFVEQAGSAASGSTLLICTARKTHTLYGGSTSTYTLVTSIADIGYFPNTVQGVSNNAYGMTARGIQALVTTLSFGDFDFASISHPIQPLITAKRGTETASTALKSKNQYRVYFSDGSAIAVGLTGDKIAGLMPLNYGRPVRCMVTDTLSTGQEVTFFGSDDGYVYQDNIGTSFDGAPIEAWVRLAYSHSKSPRMRKRYRRAILEGKVVGYSKINFSYDLGYGNPNVQPSDAQADTVLLGGGGYWDQFIWDQFLWDSQVVVAPSFTITGTEKSISMLFYSNRAQDRSHTLQGVTIQFTQRRLER